MSCLVPLGSRCERAMSGLEEWRSLWWSVLRAGLEWGGRGRRLSGNLLEVVVWAHLCEEPQSVERRV